MRSHAKALVAALILLGSLVLGVTFAAGTSPTVAIDPPSDVKFASAHVSGSVDPEDGETSYRFEYAIDPDTEGWISTGFQPIADGGPTPVQADLSGLKPGSTYRVRLVASNFIDPDAVSTEETFTTEAVDPPEVSGLLISAITADSAHFEASVNSGGPNPGEASEYRFQCSPECPGLSGFQPFTSDGANHTVQADATSLDPNTPYTVTAIVQDAAGLTDEETAEPLPSFETDPIGPQAATASVHGYPTDTAAHIAGSVNPHNSSTAYWFEYATQADFSDAQSAPASKDADAGSGAKAKLFGQDLSGLEPNTTYHYRIVADNGVGLPVAGSEETFTTAPTPPPAKPCPNAAIRQQQGSAQLGSCRAWELVSAGPKNKAPLLAGAISADGNRALIAAAGDIQGGGLNSPSLATRTPAGWLRSGLLPPAGQRLYPNYGLTAYSADLTRFVAVTTPGLGGSGPAQMVALDDQGHQTILSSYLGGNGSTFGTQVASDDLSAVYTKVGETVDPEHVPGTENLYDIAQDPPVLISRLPDGTVPLCGVSQNRLGFLSTNSAGSSAQRWVSADGSRIFFVSSGSEDPSCSAPPQLYVRDRIAGETTLISAPAVSGALQEAEFLQASADGSIVFFGTATKLSAADTDGLVDVYRWSAADGAVCVTCVTGVSANLSPGLLPFSVAVSVDLSHVYFVSPSVLAAGGTEGEKNLYVWRASGGSGPAGTIEYLGPNSGSVINNPVGGPGQLSPDGRVLLFQARDPGLNTLSGSDNGGHPQVYRYDDGDHSLSCVSCPAAGPAEADASAAVENRVSVSYVRVMSDDGSRIVFHTADALVADDVNGVSDLYEWHNGAVSLIGDGVSVPAQRREDRLIGISPDGHDVLFLSDAALTAGILDTNNQLYDARIDGGVPIPVAAPTPCAGDGCRAAPAGAPAQPAAASATFSGPADPKSKRHKHKRRHQKTKKRGQRAAHNQRGARR